MEYAYKFRLYPNREQENLILRTFGCCRFLYNYFLDIRSKAYNEEKKTLGYNACAAQIPALKEQLPWLKEVDSTALQSAVKSLDTAYQNFFRRVKSGVRPFGYPKFKSKHDRRQCYTSKRNGETIKIVDGKHIRLPKLGSVKCAISKEVTGRILSATVSRNPSGRYFISICCTDPDIPKLPSTGAVAGVDLGIKELAVTSDGELYPNNKYTSAAEKRLIRLQRSLSRKTKGSANSNKARIQVARLHEKIANQRRDNLHKLTAELVRSYDIICIEDLNAKGMVRNRHLAKAISDAAFGEFRRQLEYKAAWYGKTVSVIDRFYPSSQLCSHCGFRNGEVKDLAVRSWVCPQCGRVHDRDINAAKNILAEGLRILSA